MYKLPTKRAIKNAPGHFSTDITGKGRHDFKSPFPVYLYVMASHEPAILEYLNLSVKLSNTDDSDLASKISISDTLLAKAPGYFRSIGILIGLYWYHRDMGLSTKYEDFVGKMPDFGDAVIEELYDAGYTVDQIGQLGNAVVIAHVGNKVNSTQLQGRLDFLGQTPTA